MESLRSQLSNIRPTLLKGQPRTIPVLKILAEIPGSSEEGRLDRARIEVLRWVSKRAGRLPQKAWDFKEFELDAPGDPASCIRFIKDEIDYWILRLNDLDHTVAGQVWTTEVTVAAARGVGYFGIRQLLFTKQEEVDFVPGVPGVVRQVAENVGLKQDGLMIGPSPWVLHHQGEVDQFVEVINDPSRRLPVIIVTLPDNISDTASAAINVDQTVLRTLGLAHLVVIPGPRTYRLTDLVGKQMSVFNGAVRTYRPGCDTATDNPFRHPLALPEAIKTWADVGPTAFADMLVKYAAKETIRWSENELPPFASVKQTAASQRRIQAQSTNRSDKDMLEMAYEDIDALTEEKNTYEALVLEEEREKELALTRAEESEAREAWLRQRILVLDQQLVEIRGGRPSEVPIPSSLDDLRDWSEQYLAGRVVLTPKAIRAAKGAKFEDTPLVYKALLMMSREYYAMKTEGGPDHQSQFDDKMKDLSLENTRTGDETRLKEMGDEFVVNYKGRKTLLAWHLKNSNTRDPARCFRLYYFWSDADSQAIVGSLPGHLETRVS